VKLVEREPPLIEVIETEAIDRQLISLGLHSPETESSSPLETSTQSAQVDSKAVRREVGSIMHSLDQIHASDAYRYGEAVANAVNGLLHRPGN